MNHILNFEYNKYKLKNGLEVILSHRKGLPLTAVNLWYRVGSANESPGKTGFAHLFEHMMFQGSLHVGKEMHFKYVQEAGGTLNGSTSDDRTNYYETLPSNALELALWLESDRMGFLLPALTQEKLDNQKDVVMNERRERYENQPYGLAWEILFNNLYPQNHPYSWPTIGWMEDIKKFSLDDVKEFFKKYYAPNNATLVIAGEFDENSTIDLVEKYFGEIPMGNKVPEVFVPEFEIEKREKIVHEDNVNLPRIYLAWHTVKAYADNEPELEILADFLSGSKNARLYKELVFEKQIAQDITAFQYSQKYDGCFIITATAKPGKSIEELKAAIFQELKKAMDSGISEKELLRSKNGIKAAFVYSLQNLTTYANQLNHYNFYLNEPNSFEYSLKRYEKASREAINDIFKNYLSKNYVELNIIPKREN